MFSGFAGTHARAVADYTSILALSDAAIDDSSRADAHYMRGTAHEKLNGLGAAIADFTATLELEPTHVKAILARGGCYNLRSDYEAACGQFLTSLSQTHRMHGVQRSPRPVVPTLCAILLMLISDPEDPHHA